MWHTLKQKNIDLSFVTTTDQEILPDAVAILDPKRDDCTYPYDELWLWNRF
jgi:single-stranded-DNA-specific exonuclease